MKQSPISSRIHVGIFGNTNAGKSSLFNAIVGQDVAIVSGKAGTTTDPVIKAVELNPFGPIAIIDTAGLDDKGSMGKRRTQKSKAILERVDIAIYTVDINKFIEYEYISIVEEFEKRKIPHILVFTKVDKCNKNIRNHIKDKYPNGVFTSKFDKNSIEELKEAIGTELKKINKKENLIIADLLNKNSSVIMVAPIDSAAPKGRLILPQVQFLRECLDNDIMCLVVKETELEDALNNMKKVDLVVTDSKVFNIVNKIVPKDIPLTSFSVLLARQKGDIDIFLKGAKSIDKLPNNAKILMAEGCTHSKTHEDIGRVKIPNLIKEHTQKDISFDFYSGYDFPKNLKDYDLVIHCGGCMLNKKAIENRLDKCEKLNIPITNYGMVLALFSGILDRSIEIFSLSNQGGANE